MLERMFRFGQAVGPSRAIQTRPQLRRCSSGLKLFKGFAEDPQAVEGKPPVVRGVGVITLDERHVNVHDTPGLRMR